MMNIPWIKPVRIPTQTPAIIDNIISKNILCGVGGTIQTRGNKLL